ncbi:MAG: hypothetical protein R3C15_15580 [Thermoleophilia bacterium]
MADDLKKLIARIRKQGYVVTDEGRRYKVRNPETGGTIYTLPKTPSDSRRGLKNCEADLRRLGVLPPKGEER